jgi:hypothetical protein
MFQDAYRMVSNFTWPILISQRHLNGLCTCGIGTLTIVNEDGWFITAHHVLVAFMNSLAQVQSVQTLHEERAAIEVEEGLSRKERQKKLAKLARLPLQTADRCSLWAGRDGLTIIDVGADPDIDLAWGRLAGFDPTWVSTYPTFKNPAMNFESGASLCKLGFPFHSITPSFDEAANMFTFPPGALPCPLFPNEGIFTRILLVAPASDLSGYRKLMLETSSPGLRGQSGGPTFDTKGRVWAMQSQTAHFDLGFDPRVPERGEAVRQFLNVGRGVHAESIIAALNAAGVTARVSQD